ncbi:MULTISPECIES: MFS transporter [unclassified Rubrivivax]|uniref:MFS transporter n=1 Tax=unclassified Rubrivivax TaxID=2649762 RepID=UPI001E5AD214|nr:MULTISPECIES: MFS transporter [unclassified Rubrivivax]MCC9596549.1 MFS transporter [Rubrivivax sp. JA1055]MCC9648705.1 MFS transporter [Rubrivivax sp. JA1029]
MNTAGLDARGPATPAARWRGGLADGLRYGALGLPLAFVALPLYVLLPPHYAAEYGVPLATLGALLLAVRLLDAVIDPALGRLVDRLFTGSPARLLAVAAAAALLLAAAFHGLFFPPVTAGTALLAWCAALLVAAYLAYSLLAVLHQAWGARLGGDAAVRARIVSWREGLALAGVLVASVLPSTAGLAATSAVFAVTLVIGLVLLAGAPRAEATPAAARVDWRAPLATPAFRRLLAVFLVNGIASAVPATLVLFFVRDRLQAPAWEPVFLAAYFAAGALAMPLWVRLVARLGLAGAWLAGMALAVAAFVWAATLGPGDTAGFVAVCVASGVALGADLALPGALLAGIVRRAGHGGGEGAYFGWWNLATKLNLALAAGLALPLLGLLGYAPGAREPEALAALTAAYCLLPCVLKTAAAALLWRWRHRLDEENPR